MYRTAKPWPDQSQEALLGLPYGCRRRGIMPSPTAFPGLLAGLQLEMEQPRLELISTRNANLTGGGISCNFTILAPQINVNK